jgi:succinyl-CoA synthetase alpha subunit
MTEFQKIAIGLLGLTHPEILLSRSRAGLKSTTKIEYADEHSCAISVQPRDRLARAIQAFRFAFAALAIGSRTVPLADNSQLRRDLAARAQLLYGPDCDC